MEETENKFEQLMNTYLDEKIWNSEILYYVSMIHEQKVRCEYLELQNPKLFQRLAKINEYEIIEGFANELGISSIRIKKIFNNKDCWIATQSATARNDGNGMDWIVTRSATARNDDNNKNVEVVLSFKEILQEINNNYGQISVNINLIKKLYNKFATNSKEAADDIFVSNWKKWATDKDCKFYKKALEMKHFDKIDRLLMSSSLMSCIDDNLKPIKSDGIILGLLNHILLLQNGYKVGKYVNILKPSGGYRDLVGLLKFIYNSYKTLENLSTEQLEGASGKINSYHIVKKYVLNQNNEFSKKEALKSCPSLGSSSVEIALRKLVDEGILERLFAGKNTRYRRL